MRILVVEDEANLRHQLQQRLVAEGYSVDVAKDGEEGRFFGEEYPFDLAVIDLGLPKLSGIELIRGLRRKQISFPILILTARDNWQDKVEGWRLAPMTIWLNPSICRSCWRDSMRCYDARPVFPRHGSHGDRLKSIPCIRLPPWMVGRWR